MKNAKKWLLVFGIATAGVIGGAGAVPATTAERSPLTGEAEDKAVAPDGNDESAGDDKGKKDGDDNDEKRHDGGKDKGDSDDKGDDDASDVNDTDGPGDDEDDR